MSEKECPCRELKQKFKDTDRLDQDVEKSLSIEHNCRIEEIRNGFPKDRDRILYTRAFRRLQHKKQIFSNKKGDHFRTRLTHTMEVAQIARSLARILCVDEDLTEAIALGHDIGHTPFGHEGEEVLDAIMRGEDDLGKIKIPINHGGFKHNYNSVKILDVTESKFENFSGLNLSWQVLEGILKHTDIKKDQKEWNIKRFVNEKRIENLYLDNKFSVTLEGQIVNIADEIAQCQHDIDDGLRGLPSTIKIDEVYEAILEHSCKIREDVINSLHDKNDSEKKYLQKCIDLLNEFINMLEKNKESYLFSWNDIPGNDNKEVIEYLKKRFDNELADNAKIKIIDSETRCLKLKDDETKVILSIDDCIIDEFIAKKEENIQKIYKEPKEIVKKELLIRNIIDYFIHDVVATTEYKYSKPSEKIITEKIVTFSDLAKELDKFIKNYIYKQIINSDDVNKSNGRSKYILRQLFKAYYNNPLQMPHHILETLEDKIKQNSKYCIIKLKGKDSDSSEKCLNEIKFKDGDKTDIDSLLCILKLEKLDDNIVNQKEFLTRLNSNTKTELKWINCNNITPEYDKFLKCLLENNYAYLSTICDYIAGMSDNYAEKEFKDLYEVI